MDYGFELPESGRQFLQQQLGHEFGPMFKLCVLFRRDACNYCSPAALQARHTSGHAGIDL
jgi:hypothetical protein